MKDLKQCCRPTAGKQVKATPLPKRKVMVTCIVNFSNQFGSLVIFPFLPFMISDFFPELDRTEIGKKAGFLGSAYYIGSFAGSFMWGWLADIIGRRPTMLLGLCGTIFSITLFGFSQNFAWAVSARLLWGLLNGNIGVVKTYLSEVCDDTNQARGFSLIATMAGIGRMLGSITGGFLARPASKYPLFDIPFFCRFPYLLPCLVALVVAIIGLVSAWLFLDETLNKSSTNKTENSETDSVADSMTRECDIDSVVTIETDLTSDAMVTNDTMVTANGKVIEDSISETTSVEDVKPLLHHPPPTVNTNWKAKLWELFYERMCCCHGFNFKKINYRLSRRDLISARDKIVTMGKLMMDRRVIVSVSLYGLLGFVVIIVNEVFPLLMVTDHNSGGYNMSDSAIGLFLTIVAIFQLSYQILLYPKVAKLLGYRHSFRAGLVVFAIGCILLPLANQISGPIESNQSDMISNNSTTLVNNTDVDYYSGDDMMNNDNGSFSLDNNLVNDTCHSSRLESSVGGNSIGHIPARVWLTVCWILTMIILGRVNSFTCVMVLIANSTLSSTRGTVNGIGQSLVAVSRSIGPLIGAPLFAWSASNGNGWPLNHHFVFDMIVIITVFIMLLSLTLPKSSEKKRIPETTTNSVQLMDDTTTNDTVINMVNR